MLFGLKVLLNLSHDSSLLTCLWSIGCLFDRARTARQRRLWICPARTPARSHSKTTRPGIVVLPRRYLHLVGTGWTHPWRGQTNGLQPEGMGRGWRSRKRGKRRWRSRSGRRSRRRKWWCRLIIIITIIIMMLIIIMVADVVQVT